VDEWSGFFSSIGDALRAIGTALGKSFRFESRFSFSRRLAEAGTLHDGALQVTNGVVALGDG
jgi:hypothetical protein